LSEHKVCFKERVSEQADYHPTAQTSQWKAKPFKSSLIYHNLNHKKKFYVIKKFTSVIPVQMFK